VGCDIHMVLEKKFANKWVGLHAYPYVSPKAIAVRVRGADLVENVEWMSFHAGQRNYKLFGALADVRGESVFGHEPLGIPYDASELVVCLAEEYGADGHSHSHMLLPEFLRCYAYAKGQNGEYEKGLADAVRGEKLPFKEFADEVLGFTFYEEEQDANQYRIVFWFDN